MIVWSDQHNPHVVVGGEHDGVVVQYHGYCDEFRGYCCTMIGYATPVFIRADSLRKITGDEANRHIEGRMSLPRS